MYKFKVSAVNAIDEGAQSDPAYAVYAARVPDPPTNVAHTTASSTHIAFNWDIPYDGGSPLTYFTIYWDEGSGLTSDTFVELAVT